MSGPIDWLPDRTTRPCECSGSDDDPQDLWDTWEQEDDQAREEAEAPR